MPPIYPTTQDPTWYEAHQEEWEEYQELMLYLQSDECHLQETEEPCNIAI